MRKCPTATSSHAAGPSLPERIRRRPGRPRPDWAHVHGRRRPRSSSAAAPQLFSARALGRLLRDVRQRVPFASDHPEVTLSQPGRLPEQAQVRDYRSLGVTACRSACRASRKPSSGPGTYPATATRRSAPPIWRAPSLRQLQPRPDARPARAAGIGDALYDLRPSRGRAHLIYYQLTVEPNTVFTRAQPPPAPEDDLLCGTSGKPARPAQPPKAIRGTGSPPTPRPAAGRGTTSTTGLRRLP